MAEAIKLVGAKITQSYNLRGLRPQRDYVDQETGEVKSAQPGAGFIDIHETVANLTEKIIDILRGSGEYLEVNLSGKKYHILAVNQSRIVPAKYEGSNTFIEDGIRKVKLPATIYVTPAKAGIENLPTVEDITVELDDVTVEEDTVESQL